MILLNIIDSQTQGYLSMISSTIMGKRSRLNFRRSLKGLGKGYPRTQWDSKRTKLMGHDEIQQQCKAC